MCVPEDTILPFPRLASQHFSVLKTLLAPPKSQMYANLKLTGLSLASQASELAKNSVSRPQIGLKFSSHCYILLRFSSLSSQKISSSPSTSPSVRPFGLHTYTKLKVKCPLLSIISLFAFPANT